MNKTNDCVSSDGFSPNFNGGYELNQCSPSEIDNEVLNRNVGELKKI